MLFSLFIISIISIIIYGYSGFFKAVFLNDTGAIIPIDFIYGVLFLSFLSIFLNFFIPLANVSHLLFFVGIILFIYFFLKKKFSINYLALILILFFFIFISSNNNLVYDSKLYHLQTIKYNYQFKTILGLSNIEPRLGMNSIWHSFLSIFNISIAGYNPIYFINIVIYSFFVNSIFQEKKISKNHSLYLIISLLYIFTYSLFHPYKNGTILNNIGSPEVDTISMIFFIITVSLFLDVDAFKKKNVVNLLLAFIFLSITTKISNILLFVIVIFILIYKFKLKKNFFSKYYFFLSVTSIVWILKSFLLSGCLIFPIRQTCFNLKWSLGQENVEGYKNIISAFNRGIFTKQEWSNFDFTINSFDWFLPWFKHYFLNTELLTISFIIVLFLLTFNILLIFKNYFSKKNINFKINEFYILIILIFSLYLWLNAPEIRLGYGPIISTTVFFIFITLRNLNLVSLVIKTCQLFVVIFICLLIYDNRNNLKYFNENPFDRRFNYEGIKMIYASNSYRVFRPIDGSFCNFFKEFCSYQGYNVVIEKTPTNYYLIKNNW